MTLSFSAFLDASRGRLADGVGRASAPPAVFAPSTDSRTLERGDSFVCLRGPSFDGHDFIAQAIERGAGAILLDDRSKAPHDRDVTVVVVPDVKAAYLAGAAAARATFGGRVIAITGSNGKTTTKDFAAQILQTRRRVVATPHNENNELGVAKLCYRLDAGAEVAVFEFGARHPGEIAELVHLARPDIGVLTGVGEAHLEFFASREELARTKFAIFSEGARAVCSAGDTWSRMLAAEAGIDATSLWTRLIGDPVTAGIMLEAGSPRDGQVALTFGASHAFARWRLPGDHNLRDALLAVGAAVLAGLSFEDALDPLGDLRLPPGRFESHRTPDGAIIIYDAYNASPSSMLQALRTFSQMPGRRRIAVLGSMAELGAEAAAHHRAVGDGAAQAGVDEVHCGGAFGGELAAGARSGGMGATDVFEYADNDAVVRRLRATLRSGDLVLLKGSRIERMEEILRGLLGLGMLAS